MPEDNLMRELIAFDEQAFRTADPAKQKQLFAQIADIGDENF